MLLIYRELNILCVKYSLYSPYDDDVIKEDGASNGCPLLTTFISISESELSDFEQIWYADANFHFEDGYLTKRNSKFFKFKMADGRHIKNRFFGYIWAPYWTIDAKFGKEMKNHMPIQVT